MKEDEVGQHAPDEGGFFMNLCRELPQNITRPALDPVLGLETIKNTMSELISEIFYQPGTFPYELPWQPPIDMYMDEGLIYVQVSLAGVVKEDIKIHATSDLLIVKGNIPPVKEIVSDQFLVRERKTGKFSRSIPLPFEVEPGSIKASFREGLLSIRVPLKAEIQPGSVKVEIE